MKHFTFVFTLACIMMTVSFSARAQTPDEAEAFNLFKTATAEISEQKFDEAIAHLDQAFKLFQMPQIMMKKGEALVKKGDLETALDVYGSVKTDDAALAAKIADTMSEIRKSLSEPVVLTIGANVAEATLVVDSVDTYKIPATITVSRGSHRFEVTSPGYGQFAEDRVISGANDQDWLVELQPYKGKLVIRTDLDSFYGVLVRLDNQDLTPKGSVVLPNRSEPIPVEPGTHSIVCAKEGLTPFVGTIDVSASGITEVACNMQPTVVQPRVINSPWNWQNPWKGVTFGLGVAALAAGAGLTGWYYAELDGRQVDGTNYHENWIGIGIGTAGAALAIVAAFVPFPVEEKDDQDDVNFSFSIAPLDGGGTAAMAMTF